MTYVPSYRPRAHQAEADAKIGDKDCFALLHAMRCGKTKVALDWFGRLESDGKVEDLLVIAPAGVYETWRDAAFDNPEKGTIGHFSTDLKKRAICHVWRATATKAEDAKLTRFMEATDRPRVLIVNIEALSTVQRARDLVRTFIRQRRTFAAVDESTTIAQASKRTDFVLRDIAPHCEYRTILCGLPTPRDPLQLYSQFEFLDWRILGHQSYFSFRNRYAILKRQMTPVRKLVKGVMTVKMRNVDMVVGFRNADELATRIADWSHRVTLADCYDMPAETWDVRHVEMTPEQRRLYAEMKAFATMTLDTSSVTATIVMVQMLRLHQLLCGYAKDEHGVEHEIPENRTAALLDILREYDGKAIVWCAYDADVKRVTRALAAEFGDGCYARFWGGNKTTREAEEVRYKSDPECRFMVATPAAGGRGRDWAVADLAIYYSSTPNLDHRGQAEDRTKAIGKTRSIGNIDLVARGTVDEKYLRALREKIDLAAIITGDNWREWVI